MKAVLHSIKVNACRRNLNSHEAASPQVAALFGRSPRGPRLHPKGAARSARTARPSAASARSTLFGAARHPARGVQALRKRPRVERPCKFNEHPLRFRLKNTKEPGGASAAQVSALMAAVWSAPNCWVTLRITGTLARTSPLQGNKALPNPSVNATAIGVPPGPRGRPAYHRPRGPGATPLSARYLKR